MIVRLLFATVFAAAVSVALWTGASALIDDRPIVLTDGPDRTVRLVDGRVEVDEHYPFSECGRLAACIILDPPPAPCVSPACIPDPPPQPPPCEWPCPEPPPPVGDHDPNPTVPLVMVPPRDFENCTLPGAVTVRIVVGPDGGRGTVTVIDSTDRCLNRPSVAAADKWLFGPSESQLPRVVTHTFTYE